MAYNVATDEFPYQIVALFERQPKIGDQVYHGPGGWYPQVTLKRRFGLRTISEAQLLGRLQDLVYRIEPFTIQFGRVVNDYLPVDVIEVINPAPTALHHFILNSLGYKIRSRYPDREGHDFSPHMTVEWNGEAVVDAAAFVSTRHLVCELWLTKDDVAADDSRIFSRLVLGGQGSQRS